MLTKITLNKVACFKKATVLETDKKVNLIYGLNGTGKSTLSNYLYKQSDPKFKDCSIAGLDDAESLVYNQTFIQENFFEAENLRGIFTLSKTNKEAETKIANAQVEIQKLEIDKQKAEAELRKAADNIESKKLVAKNKIWEIKTSYTGGDRVLEFCLEGYKSDGFKLLGYVESLKKPAVKPTKTINEIKEEVQALAGEGAQKYSKLTSLGFNRHAIEEDTFFNKQIVGNENSTVADFITKLGNSDWVKEGLQYLPTEINENEKCPFCQHQTISKELFNNIKDYFDESYENDLKKLKDYLTKYTEDISLIPDKSVFEASPKFKPYKKEFEILYNKFFQIFSGNKKLIQDKIKNPSHSITLESSKETAKQIANIITAVNKSIEEHNRKIDNKDKSLAEIRMIFWELMRWEYDQTISTLALEKQNATTESSTIIQKIKKIQDLINAEQKIILEQQKNTVNIEESIMNINNGLVELGIDEFKIVKYSEALYKISRLDAGARIFHSLSEGEKMIISFLYFLELCRGKKSVADTEKKKIIVIDDPISSLSHIYIFNVGRLIHNEFLRTDKYEQIFVLTHSLYFFYELTDTNHDRRQKSQKLFRIRKNSAGSEILEMHYDEIQNDYHSYWHMIKDEKQPPALIANCMRNIIEYFYNFVEKKDLNNVFQKSELQENRFQAFNRYINRESHSLGQNIYDFKEFNYADFKDAFELVFKINGYEAHYKKMIT